MALNLPELAGAATRAAERARAETLPRFRTLSREEVETKADGSPVTVADRAAERVLAAELAAALPGAAIYGEEYGGDRDAELLWVVDPIDGTLSFTRGIPLFGTLIALVEGGRPVLGLIDLPALGERYVGWLGGGCWSGKRRVYASACAELDNAVISHGDPYCFDLAGERAALRSLTESARVLRGYTDAFGHALVVRGSVDAMIDLDLAPWDASPAQVLVPEAGGRCETLRYRGGKVGLVMGAPSLVERLVPLLENAEHSGPGRPER